MPIHAVHRHALSAVLVVPVAIDIPTRSRAVCETVTPVLQLVFCVATPFTHKVLKISRSVAIGVVLLVRLVVTAAKGEFDGAIMPLVDMSLPLEMALHLGAFLVSIGIAGASR